MDPQQSTTAVASPTDNQQFRKQTTRKLVCLIENVLPAVESYFLRSIEPVVTRIQEIAQRVSSLECRLGAVALLATSRGKARSRHASYVTRRIMRSDGSQHGFDERH